MEYPFVMEYPFDRSVLLFDRYFIRRLFGCCRFFYPRWFFAGLLVAWAGLPLEASGVTSEFCLTFRDWNRPLNRVSVLRRCLLCANQDLGCLLALPVVVMAGDDHQFAGMLVVQTGD